jgi:acyl dehydratase
VVTPFAGARAVTLHGTVKNGTTGKAAAGIEVILIQLQGGMQPVINSKTDGQGQFTFDHPSLGAQPMLVRAVYRGVNFHQPVPPGKNEVEVEVFDPTQDAKTIAVSSRVVVFQPDGESLIVGEEYSIENHSQPPMAYFRADGDFDFVCRKKRSCNKWRRGDLRECRWCRLLSTTEETATRSHLRFVRAKTASDTPIRFPIPRMPLQLSFPPFIRVAG